MGLRKAHGLASTFVSVQSELTPTDYVPASSVVTGASDGIGREFAVQLARAGFNVVLVARNQTKLADVVSTIGVYCYGHGHALFLTGLFS
jgi:17beta-estradiol 17-dehydrogenase / very-long-chain 3-oxoacyl-CoA reductase